MLTGDLLRSHTSGKGPRRGLLALHNLAVSGDREGEGVSPPRQVTIYRDKLIPGASRTMTNKDMKVQIKWGRGYLTLYRPSGPSFMIPVK